MASRPAPWISSFRSTCSHFARDRTGWALALGYGCFRGANHLMYTSAMATHTGAPIMFVPTPLFTLAASIAALVCATAIAWAALRKSRQGQTILPLPVLAPTVILLVLQIVILGLPDHLASRSIVATTSALIYGPATTVINLAWLATFVAHGSQRGLRAFAVSMVVLSLVALVTSGFAPLPRFATSSALLIFSTLAFLHLRHWSADGRPFKPRPTSLHSLQTVDSAVVASAVLECAVGLLNGLFMGRSLFVETGALFPLGSLGGALGFALMSFALPTAPPMQRVYRLLFPAIAAVVAMLPFTGSGENPALGAALAGLYGFLSYCALYFVLATVMELGLDVVVIAALVTIIVRTAQLAGLIVGYLLGRVATAGFESAYALGGMVAVYGLAMLLLVLSRKKPRSQSPQPSTEQPLHIQRAQDLAMAHHLTRRETQVLELLARGRSAAVVAEELSCSPGTVRNHAKHIYAKLGVHSKQEIIDLFVKPS